MEKLLNSKVIKFFKSYNYILLSVLINLLINYRFFLGYYFSTGDNPNITKNLISKALTVTLISDYNFVYSSRVPESARILLHNIFWIFYKLFDLNFNTSFQTIFIILPWIVIGSVFSFLLSEMYSKSKILSVISSIFFVNSSYFVCSLYMGHTFLVVANTFIPMIFYFYLKYGLERLKLSFFLLLIFVSSIYDLRFVVIFLLLVIFIEISKSLFLQKVNNFLYLIKMLTLFILLNSYWAVPEVLMRYDEAKFVSSTNISSSVTPNLLQRGFFGGMPNDITYTLLNQHPFIDFSSFKIFSEKKYQIFLYFLPLTLLLCIYSYVNFEKNFPINPFLFYSVLFCFLIFVILSKVNSFPLINSYILIDDNFRIFTSIFRDGTRYYPVITLLYIFFISLFYNVVKLNRKLNFVFLFLYFLISIYYIFVSQKIKLDNNLNEVNNNLTSKIAYDRPYTILSIDNDFSEKLYPGDSNSRLIILDQFINKYNFNPIELCKNNVNDFHLFVLKYNIRYIITPKNYNYNETCFKNFKNLELTGDTSSMYKILENENYISLFTDENYNNLEYQNFLNVFYSIEVPKNTAKIVSSIYFHPSWYTYRDLTSVENQPKLEKNDYEGVSIYLSSENSTIKIYLIYYPQLIYYLLLIPTLFVYLVILYKNIKYGISN